MVLQVTASFLEPTKVVSLGSWRDYNASLMVTEFILVSDNTKIWKELYALRVLPPWWGLTDLDGALPSYWRVIIIVAFI